MSVSFGVGPPVAAEACGAQPKEWHDADGECFDAMELVAWLSQQPLVNTHPVTERQLTSTERQDIFAAAGVADDPFWVTGKPLRYSSIQDEIREIVNAIWYAKRRIIAAGRLPPNATEMQVSEELLKVSGAVPEASAEEVRYVLGLDVNSRNSIGLYRSMKTDPFWSPHLQAADTMLNIASVKHMVSDYKALADPFGETADDRAAVIHWYNTHRAVLARILPCPCEPTSTMSDQTAHWAASCGLVACASVQPHIQQKEDELWF
jgi:hypothetical protein